MSSLLLAATAASGAPCTVPAEESSRQVALAYAAFDGQPAPYGWRHLNGSACVDAAIALLMAYQQANVQRLAPAQAMELSFHVGQALALAGREPESVAHFERALRDGASAEWRAYVEATLAFLRHDPDALKAAQDRYGAIAPGSMRLRFIKGFIACPNAPYAKAVHCGM